MSASTLTYPLDLIRTVLSVKVQDDGVKTSILKTGVEIFKREGPRGLYKGLNATLIGITPYVGLKMASYDILKTFFQVDQKNPNAQVMNFTLGGVAGTIAVSLTYPTDVIRRKMQMSGAKGHDTYTGFMDCGNKVYAKEGFLGLYKGFVPCLLKVAPAMAILFWCNEMLKSKLA